MLQGNFPMPRRSSGLPPGKAKGGQIRFTDVTRSTRADFENLFEQPGAPKYCWCMAWRRLENREHAPNDERRRAVMALVEAGTPVGILAHAEGKTVGWCSVAPRETYRKMSRQQDDTEAGIIGRSSASTCRGRRAAVGWQAPCSTRPSITVSPTVPGQSRPIRSTRLRRATDSWDFETCSWPADSTRSAWLARAGM
jgi:hypothetical protein